MTNTLKHTQTSTLYLKLIYEPTQVQLQVEDNGRGFDPMVSTSDGYGVIGMQERSQQIGAQFRLTSRIGQGTIVRVTVPIKDAKPYQEQDVMEALEELEQLQQGDEE